MQHDATAEQDTPLNEMGFRASLATIGNMTMSELHQTARSSWQGIHKTKRSNYLEEFMASTVIPCLRVLPHTCKKNAMEKTLAIAGSFQQGNLSEVAASDLRIACQVASGALENHPCVQGILLAVLDSERRRAKGIEHNRGLTTITNLDLKEFPQCKIHAFNDMNA